MPSAVVVAVAVAVCTAVAAPAVPEPLQALSKPFPRQVFLP